jgi:hypothetical protein
MTEPDSSEPPAIQSEDPAHQAGTAPPVRTGMFLLELVPVPVSDIDRAKAYYSERLGFHVDVDVRPADGVRVVQLTPPGSACSITLTTGIPWLDMPAGSLRGLHLVVSDIGKPAPRSSTAGWRWVRSRTSEASFTPHSPTPTATPGRFSTCRGAHSKRARRSATRLRNQILRALVPEADLQRVREAGPVRRDYPVLSSRQMEQVAAIARAVDRAFVRMVTEAFELELER